MIDATMLCTTKILVVCVVGGVGYFLLCRRACSIGMYLAVYLYIFWKRGVFAEIAGLIWNKEGFSRIW